jgi:hypothetical protein
MNSITWDVISFGEGEPLVHRHDEPSAAHALAKPLRSRKLAMLPLTHDFRDGQILLQKNFSGEARKF